MKMVSDVLFDTAERIKDWMKEFPDVYEPWREKLEKVLAEMDAIRKELPPNL